ncbi:unnamed protein product [Trifolium pratense]|uniref:Uncharacterized protein n=1 Tax=Trifolium pratense TaxID=57577 RepID=A0ACB0M0P4_TRIPR|nr:unnamed protein product [Trifolium pratense]
MRKQDIKSCPIYVASPEFESIVESDLVYCIKLFDRVSSFDAEMIRVNRLVLTWSGTNFDIRMLEISILLVLVLGAIVRIYYYFKMKGEDDARLDPQFSRRRRHTNPYR